MTASKSNRTAASQLTLAFAPVHKVALGIAVGLVSGVLLFSVTMIHIALDPNDGGYLSLLGQYFYGYSVSPAGGLLGLLWGFVTGFVAGWFLAFVCNLTVTATLFALRTKAELEQTNDFLDHI